MECQAPSVILTKPFDPKEKRTSENLKPIVQLVCHEEAFSYGSDIPLEMETGKVISDYLPSEITYTYDFGDDWRHHIVVEDFIDDYYYNHPTCIAGEGNVPPEDVGGEPGY
ncbi:hypothetical protein GCM10011351_25230 [Paraliobacillus quinghaiensis]|uniref:Plasmid pRiA4b Orf3-like domain-containing protein n=1 Tax=Paraliobacillus quinghaiensis TaxID=470815 RepID=A0A917TU27_9BACI|nr:plasmid pRiA4b ORF-3 family protein [Paraliobacillus quinghaiensis]GGM37997.1 hypothetical protein GCM10011351_25230 [Paraliobacillus quinghaiensis]